MNSGAEQEAEAHWVGACGAIEWKMVELRASCWTGMGLYLLRSASRPMAFFWLVFKWAGIMLVCLKECEAGNGGCGHYSSFISVIVTNTPGQN